MSAAASVDIYDPDLYVDGPIHQIFAELRRTDPVHWQPMPDEPGYWAVLKHGDLKMAASKLIERANENGGPDNITAILARWVEDGAA